MLVPFGHKKIPERVIWREVPESLPPTWDIPFPPKLSISNEALDDPNRLPRIARFERSTWKVGSTYYKGYVFKEWV